MATINQLISEIAHIAQSPNDLVLRRLIHQEIIHTRNELIRKSFNNQKYIDKSLQQRFHIELINVPDGDSKALFNDKLPIIKRSKNRVLKPTRLSNGIPFLSVRTISDKNSITISYADNYLIKFNSYLPGMSTTPTYDYINGYLYIGFPTSFDISNLEKICIESIFEYPNLDIELSDVTETHSLDDEYFISEDIVGSLKDIVINRLNLSITKETNETPNTSKLQ